LIQYLEMLNITIIQIFRRLASVKDVVNI